MTSSILCLDLGTVTGWARRDKGGNILSGTMTFRPTRYEGGGMRFLRFSRWLNEVMTDVDVVYFEEVRRHLGVDAAHVYGGFLGALTSTCELHGTPYQGVPVGTIKKHATGKGNAGKDEMLKAAADRGHVPTDDNEADAICLLYWAISEGEGK